MSSRQEPSNKPIFSPCLNDHVPFTVWSLGPSVPALTDLEVSCNTHCVHTLRSCFRQHYCFVRSPSPGIGELARA